VTTEHPRPTDVAEPREGQQDSPGPVRIDQTQAARSRTRALAAVLAALAVLAVAAGAYAWYRDTAADTARQVLVHRDQLQCRGDDVRVGSNHIDVSGPDVACTGNVEIHNDSGRAVHVSNVTFGLAGPGNSHPVIVTSIDSHPDVDSDGKQGVDAGLDLDLDVAAGTFIRVPYEVGYNPRQCDPGTIIFGGWPTVGIDVMHHHFDRNADGKFRMHCS
jgi:hypothetical protein